MTRIEDAQGSRSLGVGAISVVHADSRVSVADRRGRDASRRPLDDARGRRRGARDNATMLDMCGRRRRRSDHRPAAGHHGGMRVLGARQQSQCTSEKADNHPSVSFHDRILQSRG